MPIKNIIRPFIIAIALLLIPLCASFVIEGWNWSPMDFVFAFVMFLGLSVAFEIVVKQSNELTYRLAAAIALLTGFALIWGNLAVGLIGEDNPANGLYLLIPVIGVIGAALSYLKAKGLSYTLFLMAGAMAIIPFIALIFWKSAMEEPPGITGVFILNTGFVLLFATSGILFKRSNTSIPSKLIA